MGQPFLFDFKQHRVAGRIIVLTLHRSLLSMAPLKQVKQVYWIVLVRVSQAHKEKQKTKNKPCHPSNQIKATLISSHFVLSPRPLCFFSFCSLSLSRGRLAMSRP